MKNRKRYFTYHSGSIAVLCVFFISILSCKKESKSNSTTTTTTTAVTPGKPTWQVLSSSALANTTGLQTIYKDSVNKFEVDFYGKFDGNGVPTVPAQAIVKKFNNDTLTIVRFDGGFNVSSLVTSINGTLNNVVYTFNNDTLAKPKLSIYNVDWKQDSCSLRTTEAFEINSGKLKFDSLLTVSSLQKSVLQNQIRSFKTFSRPAEKSRPAIFHNFDSLPNFVIGNFVNALVSLLGPEGAIVAVAVGGAFVVNGIVLSLGFTATQAAIAALLNYAVIVSGTANAAETVNISTIPPSSPQAPQSQFPANSQLASNFFLQFTPSTVDTTGINGVNFTLTLSFVNPSGDPYSFIDQFSNFKVSGVNPMVVNYYYISGEYENGQLPVGTPYGQAGGGWEIPGTVSNPNATIQSYPLPVDDYSIIGFHVFEYNNNGELTTPVYFIQITKMLNSRTYSGTLAVNDSSVPQLPPSIPHTSQSLLIPITLTLN